MNDKGVYETIAVSDEGAVRTVALNRPQRHNALSPVVVAELRDALSRAAEDEGVRVLLLCGNGKSFCAGADLGGPDDSPTVEVLMDSTALFNQLEDFPKPTIAAVQGVACAGGLELVLACDLVVAEEDARIADIHANVGLLPGTGGTYRLVRRVGPGVAAAMILTGDFMPVADLKAAGLVNYIAGKGAARADATTLALRIAAKSPLGLSQSKRLIRKAQELAREEALEDALEANRRHMRSHDYAEGLTAMLEKRPPQFIGR